MGSTEIDRALEETRHLIEQFSKHPHSPAVVLFDLENSHIGEIRVDRIESNVPVTMIRGKGSRVDRAAFSDVTMIEDPERAKILNALLATQKILLALRDHKAIPTYADKVRAWVSGWTPTAQQAAPWIYKLLGGPHSP